MQQNSKEPAQYKKNLTVLWNQRKNYDDTYRTHRALRLLECAQIRPGYKILDIATGTGIVALAAAQLVGPSGSVTGVDISTGMLQQAQQKLANTRFNNVEFQEADVETLALSIESIDTILISSALMWLSDIPTALGNYQQWLKPKGQLLFSCYTKGSFLIPLVVKVGNKMGLSLTNRNEVLGNPDKIRAMLERAGFGQVSIKSEQLGSYLSLQATKNLWQELSLWMDPLWTHLLTMPAEQQSKMKSAYEAEIDTQASAKGFWHEIVIFYVSARK